MPIAAHEACQGHDVFANKIKKILDLARIKPTPTNVINFPKELSGLILTKNPERPLNSLVVDDELKERIDRVVLEFRQQQKLKTYGLGQSSKLLLSGDSGTG